MDARSEYGLRAEFLYRYLNGSSVKGKGKVGLSAKSAPSDISMMKDAKVVTVKDAGGQFLGWTNGYILFCEDVPTKRPANWDDALDGEANGSMLDKVMGREGKMVWPVEVVSYGKGYAVKFVTCDGIERWVQGKYVSALLKRLGKVGRREDRAIYRMDDPEHGGPVAVQDGDKVLGCAMPLSESATGKAIGADAEITVNCRAEYMPPPPLQVGMAIAADAKPIEPMPEPAPEPEMVAEPPAAIETTPEPVTVPEPPKSRRPNRPVLLDAPTPKELPSPAFYVVTEGCHERAVYL